jgi:putative ABC transport system ATP-binding protein
LDYRTGKQVLGLLQDSCREHGRTVAIVTHNSAFTQIADRVIHVREGRADRIETNASPLDAASVEW